MNAVELSLSAEQEAILETKAIELAAKTHCHHYQTEIQPIEVMQANMTPAEFIGYLRGNIIKYTCRMGKKDTPEKEADKIARYAEWLAKATKGEKINPRE